MDMVYGVWACSANGARRAEVAFALLATATDERQTAVAATLELASVSSAVGPAAEAEGGVGEDGHAVLQARRCGERGGGCVEKRDDRVRLGARR